MVPPRVDKWQPPHDRRVIGRRWVMDRAALSVVLVLGSGCAEVPPARSFAATDPGLVAVCHAASSGDPVVLFLRGSELRRHLGHGDTSGPCSPLRQTLVPPSHAVIDCQGGELLPTEASQDLAVLLWDVEDVTIRDCSIVGGFNHAILVALGGSHEITGNEMHALEQPLAEFLATEGVVFQGNRLFSGNAFAVHFHRAARQNQLVGNWIYGGGVAMYDHSSQPVLSYIVNGRLYQLPRSASLRGIEENVVEGNHVDVTHGDSSSPVGRFGIGNSLRPRRNVMRGNHIRGGDLGMGMLGGEAHAFVALAGTCTGIQPASDATSPRYCGSEDFDDCNIPGYDAVPVGTCVGVASTEDDERVISALFEDNEVDGATVAFSMIM